MAAPVLAARLDHVGVQRALHEETDVVELVRLLLEHADELGPDPLALLLGIADALQPRQEPICGVDRHQRHVEVVAERLDHLSALVLAHQPVVDEHAGQPVADRAVHEQRRHARVDPARQAADGPPVPHLGADPLDLLLDHRGRAPGALAAAHVGQEVGQDLLPVRRVDHLGVELDAVEPALHRLERRHRRGRGGGQRAEAGRRREYRVAVGHPAGLLGRRARQQPSGLRHRQLRAAELADLGALDPPAQRERQQLHPVTDAEHRHAQVEQLRVERRRAVLVHRGRPAGQDHALGPAAPDLLEPDVMREQLGEHPALAHPARDQLRVLASEVEDDDLFASQLAASVRTGPHVRPRLRRASASMRSPTATAAMSAAGRRAERDPYDYSTATAAAVGLAPMPTPCSRWRCLPSVWSAGATASSARLNSAMSR